MSSDRDFVFGRYGRSYHLAVRSAHDLRRVLELDEAHWVATNTPTTSMNCDPVFLDLLDTDDNHRIMCRELKDGITWLFSVLRNTEGVTSGSRSLRLDVLNTDSDDGRRIEQAAGKVLNRAGRPDAQEVTLEQVREVKRRVESTPVSEAGVVLPEAAKDDDITEFIVDLINTVGGAPHPGGEQGVGGEQLSEFLEKSAEYLDWHVKGSIPAGEEKTGIMPLGDPTSDAYAALVSIRGKLDQYFAQCEAAALDETFVQRMGWTEEELKGLDFDDPDVIVEVLENAPLAKARSDRRLVLTDSLNPFYVSHIREFVGKVVSPVIGQTEDALTASQWQEIKDFFEPHRQWAESKPGGTIDTLGVERLRAYQDKRYAEALRALIAKSSRTAVILDNIRLVEKVILYQANMIDLVNNFVSFPYLYDAEQRAMFEMGSLVMDSRRFNLAVKSDNRAEHARVAASSNMFVLYVEIVPRDASKKYEVALPITSGGKGNLCVGKRGVFCDINGNLCDARVVHIIENPISIREAIVSPFRRLGAMLTGKIEAIAASAEKKFETEATTSINQVGPSTGAPAPAVQPQQPGMMSGGGGLLLGGGVAVAALGSAVAFITKTLSETSWGAIFAGVLVAALLVMLPMSIVAFLKLRRQDISAILEGSGWAINARMRLTRAQRRFFTQKPRYPKQARYGAHFSLRAVIVLRVIIKLLVFIAILTGLSVGGYYLGREIKRRQALKEAAKDESDRKEAQTRNDKAAGEEASESAKGETQPE
jgi:hypothetical protein